MNSTFEKWFSLIEKDRIELTDILEKTPKEKLEKQPQPGKWSIAEILSHLITADRLSLGYMKKKSQGIELVDDAGWFEELKMLIFIASQRLPINYKAPSGVLKNTPENLDVNEQLNQWELIRKEYDEFLTKIPAPYVKRKIYKHPIMGRVDAKLCLQSIYEHYHHHLPQIKRLLY